MSEEANSGGGWNSWTFSWPLATTGEERASTAAAGSNGESRNNNNNNTRNDFCREDAEIFARGGGPGVYLATGARGSGKTEVLRRWLRALVASGDVVPAFAHVHVVNPRFDGSDVVAWSKLVPTPEDVSTSADSQVATRGRAAFWVEQAVRVQEETRATHPAVLVLDGVWGLGADGGALLEACARASELNLYVLVSVHDPRQAIRDVQGFRDAPHGAMRCFCALSGGRRALAGSPGLMPATVRVAERRRLAESCRREEHALVWFAPELADSVCGTLVPWTAVGSATQREEEKPTATPAVVVVSQSWLPGALSSFADAQSRWSRMVAR